MRLDLTFEHLEDLQLALAGVLDRPDEAGDVTVTFRAEDGAFRAIVGPFRPGRLRAELAAAGAGELGLRRLLDTVCDEVTLAEREGGEWVEFSKSVGAVPT